MPERDARLHAVAFDFDDTLVDWPSAVRAAALAVAPDDDDLGDRLLAHASEHCWRREDGVVIHRNTWQLAEHAEEHFGALGRIDLAGPFRAALTLQPFDGAAEVLTDLRERLPHLTIAIGSNNRRVAAEAHDAGLAHLVDHVVHIGDAPGKPHRNAFAKLCRALGTTAPRTMYVGDSVFADVRGARAAGLIPVWFDRYGDAWSPPAGVHRIDHLAEVVDLVAQLRR